MEVNYERNCRNRGMIERGRKLEYRNKNNGQNYNLKRRRV